MNNKSSEAYEALKVYMKDNHNAKIVSGGREILKRCHICGDSRDPTDAHMYIGFKDGVILYNCFKCNEKGIVDGKFMRDLGCYDPSIITLCQEQNSNSANSTRTQSGQLRHVNARTLQFPVSNNEFAQKKLDYFNRRLGLRFDYSDLVANKIVLNLKEFLLFNGITRFTRNEELMDLLDKFFIGFLSCDNRYIILRRLVPEGKLPQYIDTRYVNYNIFGSNNGNKFFIIPAMIDVLRPISIHIAEGVFDVLSIYHNLHKLNGYSNAIYAAVCGKNYMSLIEFLIMSHGFITFDLHLYPDADIDDREMVNIKNNLRAFNIRIFIHRNRYPGEKDYGVSMDRINDVYYNI